MDSIFMEAATLSTRHIHPVDREYLDHQAMLTVADEVEREIAVSRLGEAYIVDMTTTTLETLGGRPAIRALFKFADRHNCRFVILAPYAPTSEDLPTYQQKPVTMGIFTTTKK